MMYVKNYLSVNGKYSFTGDAFAGDKALQEELLKRGIIAKNQKKKDTKK